MLPGGAAVAMWKTRVRRKAASSPGPSGELAGFRRTRRRNGTEATLGVVPAQGFGLELEEVAGLDGLPGVVDHLHHEALVVDRDQRGRDHFLGLEQVVDV